MNSKFSVFLLLLFLTVIGRSADVILSTNSLTLKFDKNGYYSSIIVEGKEILKDDKFPILTACVNDSMFFPTKINYQNNILVITMDDGKEIKLLSTESESSISLEVIDIPDYYEVLLFGPVGLKIRDVVGEVIGVVQGEGVAFGIQSLNIKTISGVPYEYKDLVSQYFDYDGQSTVISTSILPSYRLAAVDIGDGTIMQFGCRNRSRTEYRKVVNIDNALTLPVNGEDAQIKGAKIAIFGCKSSAALYNVGLVELEYGLPHPMIDGEWAKTNRSSMQSYLITGFNKDNLDFVIEKAKIAGFNYIYHMDAFKDWGHFNWNPDFVKGGDEEVRALVEYAENKGIHVGVHTLSNFLTPNDAYVTPIPSEHLLKQAVLQLMEDIDDTQTEIYIRRNEFFVLPSTLKALQIESELIIYESIDTTGKIFILKNCKRGAFDTYVVAHTKEKPLYKLWDYPYKTFFPDLELQDKFSDRIVEMFNNTGFRQISFDGLEGCTYTGQDDYATARFVMNCYEGWKNPIINDASNLNHFTWHVHTRMNWGEPWGEEMREGQVESRIKNQAFFRRNLFPRMLGWFMIRLSDKKFECTSLEDLEWALSESVGFDAGYAMTISSKTLEKHGQIDKLLKSIREWDELRELQILTDEQKEKLCDPKTEWHLEKLDDGKFKLYQMFISQRFTCSLGEMQPGQSGGSDWSWYTPYGGKFALKILVDGDGEIRNPKVTTSSGIIEFPCVVKDGQYLIYSYDGSATVTDRNYNVVEIVQPRGKATLLEGTSSVSFYCDHDTDVQPDVVVRYYSYGDPLIINL